MGLYDRDYMKEDYPGGGKPPHRPSLWGFVIGVVLLAAVVAFFVLFGS